MICRCRRPDEEIATAAAQEMVVALPAEQDGRATTASEVVVAIPAVDQNGDVNVAGHGHVVVPIAQGRDNLLDVGAIEDQEAGIRQKVEVHLHLICRFLID